MTAPRLRVCPHCGGSLRPPPPPWPRPDTAAARILDALHRFAPLPLGLTDLADETGATEGTVSQHLTRLVRAGYVTRWKVGNTAQYRATSSHSARHADETLDIDTSYVKEEERP